MTPDTAALRRMAEAADDLNRALALDPDSVRALCDAADEVERLRADRDALREQVQRLRASRESNRGGWARTLVERDALRAAVDRVRALGERDGRDRLAAWLASNGVEQADTVAVEAAAFVLAALESGNYGTPEWFSSIDKPLFPPSADEVERLRANGNGYLQRAHAAEAVIERMRCAHCGEVGCDWIGDIRKARAEMAEAERDASRTAHAALVADLRALHVREVAQRQTGHGDNAEGIWLCAECLTEYPCRTAALLDRHAPTTGATP